MAKPKGIRWNRKGGDESDVSNLITCLTAIVHLASGGDEMTIPVEVLKMLDGSVGLRARYEDDGSITLWTYDVVDDMASIYEDAGGGNEGWPFM